VAGLVTTTVTTPLSMVSNYIVSEKKKHKRDLPYFEGFSEIFKKSGWKGFYNGYLFSLVLVINPMVNMQAFELLKRFLPKLFQKDLALFLAGALSKLAATLVTYPLQTLKITMQAATEGRSSLNQIIFLLKEFGPLGLFKGRLQSHGRS
jgi:adenine nucleotide transporter 17